MANLSPIQFQATATTAGSEFSAPAQEENSGVFLGELKDALGLQGAANAAEKKSDDQDETGPQDLNAGMLGLQILPEAALQVMPVAANFATSDAVAPSPAELDAQVMVTATDMRPVLPSEEPTSLQMPSAAQALAAEAEKSGAASLFSRSAALPQNFIAKDKAESVSTSTPKPLAAALNPTEAVLTAGAVVTPSEEARKTTSSQTGVHNPSVSPLQTPISLEEAPKIVNHAPGLENFDPDEGPTDIATLANANRPSSPLSQAAPPQDNTPSAWGAVSAAAESELELRTSDMGLANALEPSASSAPTAIASQVQAPLAAADKPVNWAVTAEGGTDKATSDTVAKGQIQVSPAEQRVMPDSGVLPPDAPATQAAKASEWDSAVAVASQPAVKDEKLPATETSEIAAPAVLNASSSLQIAGAAQKDLPRPMSETTAEQDLLLKQVSIQSENESSKEFQPGLIDQSQAQTSFTSTLLGQFTALHHQAPAQQIFKPSSVPAPLEPHQVQLDAGEVKVEIMRLVKQGGGQIVMELTPPDQSKFRIDLKIDAQGVASLVVEGASDSTRSRLERGAEGLQQQFADMGLALQLDMRQSHDPGAQREAMQQMQSNLSSAGAVARATASSVPLAQRSRSVGEGQVHIYA